MGHDEVLIATLDTMSLGYLIARQASKGNRASGSTPMPNVAIGFLFITAGAILEGLLVDATVWALGLAGTLQTGIVAVGMVVILYSLYGQMPAEDG
jgi:hypothetical protein